MTQLQYHWAKPSGGPVIINYEPIFIDGWTEGWKGWMDGWMDGWVDGWIGAWIEGWMNGWTEEIMEYWNENG